MVISESDAQSNELRGVAPIIMALGYSVGGSRDNQSGLMNQYDRIKEQAHAILERAGNVSVQIGKTNTTILAILEESYRRGRGYSLYQGEGEALVGFAKDFLRENSHGKDTQGVSLVQRGADQGTPANELTLQQAA